MKSNQASIIRKNGAGISNVWLEIANSISRWFELRFSSDTIYYYSLMLRLTGTAEAI